MPLYLCIYFTEMNQGHKIVSWNMSENLREFTSNVIFLTSSLAIVMSSWTSANTVGWTKYPLSPWRLPPATSLAPCFFPESIKWRILVICSSSTCVFSSRSKSFIKHIYFCHKSSMLNLVYCDSYLFLYTTVPQDHSCIRHILSLTFKRGKMWYPNLCIQRQSEKYEHITRN